MKPITTLLLFSFLITSCTTYNYYTTTEPTHLYASKNTSYAYDSLGAKELIIVSGKKKKRNQIRYRDNFYGWAAIANCTFFEKSSKWAYQTEGSDNTEYGSLGSGGPVHVKGYTKKNGTYVAHIQGVLHEAAVVEGGTINQ